MARRRKFIFVWNEAVRGSDMPTTRKAVLWCLATYMNARGREAWPSVTTLARGASLSERATRRHLKAAVRDGWLARWRGEYSRGRGSAPYEYAALVPGGYLRDVDPDDEYDYVAAVDEQREWVLARRGSAGASAGPRDDPTNRNEMPGGAHDQPEPDDGPTGTSRRTNRNLTTDQPEPDDTTNRNEVPGGRDGKLETTGVPEGVPLSRAHGNSPEEQSIGTVPLKRRAHAHAREDAHARTRALPVVQPTPAYSPTPAPPIDLPASACPIAALVAAPPSRVDQGELAIPRPWRDPDDVAVF